jgi:hypothetical protein
MFLLKKPDVPLANFLSPLTLEHCVDRLQSRHGAFFDIKLDIQIEQRDDDCYVYEIRVQRGGRYAFDVSVMGALYRQDDATTAVVVERKHRRDVVTTRKLASVLVVCGLFLIFVAKNILVFLLPLFLLALLLWDDHDNAQQIVNMIKSTLSVPTK